MKIALCLHGYFNSSRDKHSLGIDGFHYINRHILDGNDVDIYIHSWDLENESIIKDVYRDYIVANVFEPQIDFKPIYVANGLDTIPFREGATPFWNVFSQYYSVQESFKLVVNSNVDYDCVIKSRFDLGRINRNTSGPGKPNPYPVQCINFDTSLDMSKFYMANWQYLETEGPADMWFYSNMENMSNFSRIYDILSTDICIGSEYARWAGDNDGGPTNTIKGWKWFLMKTGLWDKKVPLQTYWE